MLMYCLLPHAIKFSLAINDKFRPRKKKYIYILNFSFQFDILVTLLVVLNYLGKLQFKKYCFVSDLKVFRNHFSSNGTIDLSYSDV